MSSSKLDTLRVMFDEVLSAALKLEEVLCKLAPNFLSVGVRRYMLRVAAALAVTISAATYANHATLLKEFEKLATSIESLLATLPDYDTLNVEDSVQDSLTATYKLIDSVQRSQLFQRHHGAAMIDEVMQINR